MRNQDDLPYIIVERDSGGGFGSFCLGALVGAGLALLFAPQTGEETQEEIRERARKLRIAWTPYGVVFSPRSDSSKTRWNRDGRPPRRREVILAPSSSVQRLRRGQGSQPPRKPQRLRMNPPRRMLAGSAIASSGGRSVEVSQVAVS